MSIIESVKNFISRCPYLDELKRINVDFLSDEKDTYSIEEVPVNTIVHSYIDGTSERQFVFVFAACLHYSGEARNNIDNSGFFENFQAWLDECSDKGDLPIMADNCTPYKIEAQSNGYPLGVQGDLNKAKYQIQCRLLYDKN